MANLTDFGRGPSNRKASFHIHGKSTYRNKIDE
jgi:hypothetical protein